MGLPVEPLVSPLDSCPWAVKAGTECSAAPAFWMSERVSSGSYERMASVSGWPAR